MGNRILLLGIFFAVFGTNAQILRNYDFDTSVSSRQLMLVNGVLEYGGSALENGVFKPLIFGGFIDSSAKEASWENHKAVNVVGLEGAANVRYYFSPKFKNEHLKDWMVGLRYGQNYLGSLAYTSDLFRFAFYGNTPFLGKYADFSGSEMRFIGFQTLGFSVLDKRSQSSLSLNLVGLTSYFRGSLGDRNPMKFYYTESGDSLYGICSGAIERAASPAYFKGLGMSVDFDYRFNALGEESGRVHTMQFSVSNLGFAFSNRYTSQRIDTSFAFGGYTINDIIDRNGLLAPGYAFQDSLTTVSSSSKWILLPMTLQLNNVVGLQAKQILQPTYGFRLTFIQGFIPHVYAGLNARIVKGLHLGLCASYGGFSGFKMNTSLVYHRSKFYVGLGSDNVLGLLSKRAFGQALSIRLRCDI
ncbi:MAG: hypothetical protein EBU82_00885 [Flavobacteriia bacterium]|nr:hypothetical protein [Flavobacteriia bacterium]